MSGSMTSANFCDSIRDSAMRRKLQKDRELLILLELKIGGVIKIRNKEVEVISDIDFSFAQVITFSGHRYGPLEIRKVG